MFVPGPLSLSLSHCVCVFTTIPQGVIGGFELLSLEESVELMLEEACFGGASGQPPEFVPLANRRNSNQWLAAEVGRGRICVIKRLSRPKVVASSWSQYLRVQ